MNTTLKTSGLLAAAIAAALMVASPASARSWGRHGGWHGHHGGSHGGWHRGGGAALGFATGALIGGALAARPYYGYGAYAYGGEPYVVDEGSSSNGGDVQYCMQRFKSYDPSSGTYMGYDGNRHPCP
jgi:hypothetical protein